MGDAKIKGLVVKKYSSFYYVQDDKLDIYECKLRGKFEKQLVLTGDKVLITVLEENKGIVEEVLPRINELYRPRIANVTMVLIVMANDLPLPSLSLLDRLLFLAYFNNIKPVIILNKSDLKMSNDAEIINDYYPKLNIKLVNTSTKTKTGHKTLEFLLADEVAVLAGPSGVGKSSLLNLLISELNIKTNEVSDKIGRGRHTTRHVELFALSNGGLIADTPGFSTLGLPAVDKYDLASYFPDFVEYSSECRFADCLHRKEKECAVKERVAAGDIIPSRYDNYLLMLEEIIENERY